MSENPKKTMTVDVVVEVSYERINDVLCTALDTGCGGSWYFIEDYRRGKDAISKETEYLHEIPLAGGTLHLWVEGEHHALTGRVVRGGVLAMAKKYPKHFHDMIEENDDAETGDVLLQCALFGEIVYG